MAISVPQIPEDSREVMRSIDEDGIVTFGQVGIEEIAYKGRWGAIGYSSSSVTPSVGEHYFTMDVNDPRFKIGDDVLITSLSDNDCYIWGEIIETSFSPSEPLRLRVHIEDVSAVTITDSNWEVQVVARPKHGITKDTSATSIDATSAGPFTFTVTADKFFPLGGKLLMIPIAAREKALVGEVLAYSGTTLTVLKNATNITVPTSYSSWAIALLDAPQRKIPYYHVTGLRVTQNPLNWKEIEITAGSVRDKDDTVDLVLSSRIVKKLDVNFLEGHNQGCQVLVTFPGTVAFTAGTGVVTGVGTNFNPVFGPVATNNDLEEQSEQEDAIDLTGGISMITAGGHTDGITITTDTAGQLSDVTTGVAATTYQRGGWPTHAAGIGYYVICIGRRDSDGWIDVFSSALSGNGITDEPPGYTYKRAIAYVIASKVDSLLNIQQPIIAVSAPNSSEIIDDGTFRNYATTQNLKLNIDALDDQLALSGTPPAASTTVAGIVELATNAETQTGTDATRAVTPQGLHSKAASDTAIGLVELATTGEASAGTDTTRAVTPAGLAAYITYVTGTFTPTVTLVGGAGNTVPVYNVNTGRYTRIGNRVFVDVRLSGDAGAEGAGTGTFTVALPIASAANHPNDDFPVGTAQNATVEYQLYGAFGSGSVISLSYFDTATNLSAFTGVLQNNTSRRVRLKFFYEV